MIEWVIEFPLRTFLMLYLSLVFLVVLLPTLVTFVHKFRIDDETHKMSSPVFVPTFHVVFMYGVKMASDFSSAVNMSSMTKPRRNNRLFSKSQHVSPRHLNQFRGLFPRKRTPIQYNSEFCKLQAQGQSPLQKAREMLVVVGDSLHRERLCRIYCTVCSCPLYPLASQLSRVQI